MLYKTHFPLAPFRIGLYPIVDTLLWIKRLLDQGVTTIQLRIKDKYDDEVEFDIASAIEISRCYKARIVINDYWRLAIKHKAWGIHLGQEDLKTANIKDIKKSGMYLGISTHNDAEINTALSEKPSYISLGHIFPTKTKIMLSSPQGLKKLRDHVDKLKKYPTVAIGGINLDRVPDVLATGVGGISVISAITKSKDWKKATVQFLKLVEKRNLNE